MDGEWCDWIALWGLINMLEIPVAIVSSLGETGLNVIYPADFQNKAQATGDMALLGLEAELHYRSPEPMASQKPQLALVQELQEKYGEGKITEEICPKCGRQFECYTRGAVRDHLRSWDHLRTRTGPLTLFNLCELLFDRSCKRSLIVNHSTVAKNVLCAIYLSRLFTKK